MDDGNPASGLLLFIVIVFINMILFGFSSGIQSLNETELIRKSSEGNKKSQRLLRIMDKPGKFINTVQIISATCSLLGGALLVTGYGRMLRMFFENIYNSGRESVLWFVVSYFLVIIVLMILLLSFGIVIPKKLGERHPEKWAGGLVYIVIFLMTIFTPLNVIVHLLSKIFLKLFRINLDEELDEVTEEEIMSMVYEGHEQGTILASEAEMITNIFELGEKEAQDIMTNRKNIVAVNGEWTVEETFHFVLEENNSRFPVYMDDLDNVKGILYLRDVVFCYRNEQYRKMPIKDIPDMLRKASFVPESGKIDFIFRDMQSEKIHMKIVIDEYGQTAGLITMEDILEEIVGNIFDEYDEVENNIIFQEDGTYLVRGQTLLEDIEEVIGIQYGDLDYDTLNGFLISYLDRIPEPEERPEVVVDKYKYKILGTENKMISLVEVLKLQESDEKEEEE